MSRKDYWLIANAIIDAENILDNVYGYGRANNGDTIRVVTESIADALNRTNTRFDKDKFINAVASREKKFER